MRPPPPFHSAGVAEGAPKGRDESGVAMLVGPGSGGALPSTGAEMLADLALGPDRRQRPVGPPHPQKCWCPSPTSPGSSECYHASPGLEAEENTGPRTERTRDAALPAGSLSAEGR